MHVQTAALLLFYPVPIMLHITKRTDTISPVLDSMLQRLVKLPKKVLC
jgi:hypothetical protein